MIRFITKHIPKIDEQREYRPDSWQVYDKDKMEILCVCDREDKAKYITDVMNKIEESESKHP